MARLHSVRWEFHEVRSPDIFAARSRFPVAAAAYLLVAAIAGVSTALGEDATPASALSLPPGFRAELLRSAGAGEGSWISMTFDDRGRLIIGRDDAGIARVTPPSPGREGNFELVEESLRHCRGVLYAYDSLYVSATNSKGFYRLRDTDGDDAFDEVRLLKPLDYRSRYGHGSNQVVLGPDGMVYLVNGNDVSFPEGAAADSPYRDPRDDLLLPSPQDAGQDNRVGHIVRTDPEGKHWEVLAGGLRNPYDLAFNADGEMFTYDADMEWDVGLPWYRPTRVNHVVSGGEYGWRWGSGKWPVYYADSLPSTLDTGLGSPTGLEFGTDSRFPTEYRRALFMGDWQNGRILAAHLTAHGASYECTHEVFVEGAPLNVCDLEFGPDGALYFITGGRGSQSGLYRVSYVGDSRPEPEPTDGQLKQRTASAEARKLRRKLESYHSGESPEAIDAAWPHLNSEDRWLRYAARLAVERQSLGRWRQRALDETRPRASITALLALARRGRPEDQPGLLAALGRLRLEEFSTEPLLDALRVYALSFIRQGRPEAKTAADIAARFSAIYPHEDARANQELSELLVYLDAPGVVARTIPLMEKAASQEEQIHYAAALTHAKQGWSIASRRAMLAWLKRAQALRGGKLLPTAIDHIEQDVVGALSTEERKALKRFIAALEDPPMEQEITQSRPLVRRWKVADLLPELAADRIASAGRAREALAAAHCLKCHRLHGAGSNIGPDLTNVGKRFDGKALLESILEPSKVVDAKYRHTSYILSDGRVVTGRAAHVTGSRIQVEVDPLTQKRIEIQRDAVEQTFPAKVSPMPAGLLDTLTKEQILDLLDLLRGGDRPAGDTEAPE